jgi:ATP phosphoribosyltransferase
MLSTESNVLGITGEDLYREFLFNLKNPKTRIIKTISWDDNTALFGKPTLCLLGPKDKSLKEMPKRLRVCINKKYTKTSKKFLSRLEDGGFTFEKLYLSGATEEAFVNNLADIVIDIMYSGKSAEKAGLRVYERIFSSDIVIIGGENAKI